MSTLTKRESYKFTDIPETIMVDGNTFPGRQEELGKGYALRGEDIAILHEMICERTSLVPDVMPVARKIPEHPEKAPLRQMCHSLASSVIVDGDGRESPFGVTSCTTSLSDALKDAVPKSSKATYSEEYSNKYDGCTIEDYWGPNANGDPPSTPQPDSYCNCEDDEHQIVHDEQWKEETYRKEKDEETGEDHETEVEEETMGDASSRFSEEVQTAIRKTYDSSDLLKLLDETAEVFDPQDERVPLDPEVIKRLVSGVDENVRAVIVPFGPSRIRVRGGFYSYLTSRDPPDPGSRDSYRPLVDAICALRDSVRRPGWFPDLDPLYYASDSKDDYCVSRTVTGTLTTTFQDHYGLITTSTFSNSWGTSIGTADGHLYVVQPMNFDDSGNPVLGIESIECAVYSSTAELKYEYIDTDVEKCRFPDDSTAYRCPPTENTREAEMFISVETNVIPLRFTLDRVDPERGEAWYVSDSTLSSLVSFAGGPYDDTSDSTSDNSGESSECAPSVSTDTANWTGKANFISGVTPFALYVLAPRARASGTPIDASETIGAP